MSNWIILCLMIIIIYLVVVLRKRIKQLNAYYRDIKMDIEILKAKETQRNRESQVSNSDNI